MKLAGRRNTVILAGRRYTAKATCRRCYGRGYVGTGKDNLTGGGVVVVCRCADLVTEDSA